MDVFSEGTLLWRALDLGKIGWNCNGFGCWLLYCSKAVRKEEAPLGKITFSGSRGRCCDEQWRCFLFFHSPDKVGNALFCVFAFLYFEVKNTFQIPFDVNLTHGYSESSSWVVLPLKGNATSIIC